MSIADIKAQARRDLHEGLGEPASYEDATLDAPVPTADQQAAGLGLTVRWHNRIVRQGDVNGDYAEVLEGVERLVFTQSELDALGIKLIRGGEINIPGLGVKFELDMAEPNDGPINRYWTVTRTK